MSGAAGSARDRRSTVGWVKYGTLALLVTGVAAGCGGGGSAKASVASTTSRSTSASTAASPKSNCDLVTDQNVSTHFGVAVQGSVQPETKICEYQAADAATGGLTVSVSATRPRGRASFQSLKSAYTAVPATATKVNPGQVWSAPTLVSNLGGDDGFFAVDLGGALTWAALRGDTSVVIQVGGSTWIHSTAGANVNTDVFGLMKQALRNVSSG